MILLIDEEKDFEKKSVTLQNKSPKEAMDRRIITKQKKRFA